MKAPPPDRAHRLAIVPDACSGARSTVLCVDDEPNALSALRRVLRAAGYRVLLAESAAEALATVDRHEVDVILADMQMPGTDGIALLEEMAGRRPQVVRILLTGSSHLQTAVDAFNRCRLFRYLLKPCDDGELRSCIRQAVDHRARKNETRAQRARARRQRADLVVDNDALETRVAERTHELTAAVRDLKGAQGAIDDVCMASVRVLSRVGQAGVAPDRGHGGRVATAAYRTARRMGVDDAVARSVLFAGALHDIGLLALPELPQDTPLCRLTPEQEALMQRHSLVGEAMLMGLPIPDDVARLVRQHHECMDGCGYPDGIAGDAIRLEARILAVASDFDDLVEGRIDGRPLSSVVAAGRLIARGSRYDGDVLAAFLDVVGTGDLGVGDSAPCCVVAPSDLRPGMVLARDLVTGDGLVLLPAGHVLDESLIARVRRATEEIGWELKPAVRVNTPARHNGDDA